ncbi:ATP-grasp domain-containing protein [Shimazuella alba]|uniref:Prokaryotic glutathione synthetase ATP-binding domain-containing protein n=1 Tax=Shimazuella alba TaxID=2690964 RepID=A0A6I4VS37_9BACL|nr:hypothetical protein [Shimazuella alba]MXQ53055.1 hypothetical protein [Shimazuella alba]
MEKKIAIATSVLFPDGGKDTKTLLATFHRMGCQAELVMWNDQQVNWEQYDIVFLHTTWDYILHVDEFRDWIKELDAYLSFLNPTELILWNMDKRYLLDLQAKGVTLPHTSFVETGSDLFAQKDLLIKPVVIKKLVSAGGRGNWLCHNQTELHQIIERENLTQEPLLVQHYEPSIVTKGEYSAVYLDGILQHIIHKLPRKGEYRVQSQYGGSETLAGPEKKMVEFTDLVLTVLPNKPKYARVDFIQDEQGIVKLMEVEVIEPDLFLRYKPSSFGRFVDLFQ